MTSPLEAKPAGTFSPDYWIASEGQEVTRLEVSSWREAAGFRLRGKAYELSRDGWLSGDFRLEENDRLLARAIKPSAWRSSYDLDIDGQIYTLERDSGLCSNFSVHDDGARVGGIRLHSSFSRKGTIDLPATWSEPVRLFVFWLVLIIWNRERTASM